MSRDRTTVLLLGVLASFALVWLSFENIRLRSVVAGEPREERPGNALALGDTLPDVNLVEVLSDRADGTTPVPVRHALQGPTAVFFFTTRCPYCSRSLPFIGSLQHGLAAKQVALLGVALDAQGARYESAVEMASGWKVFAAPDVRTAAQLRVHEVPTLALIDQRGTIVEIWTGEQDAARVEEIVIAASKLQ